MNCIIKISSKFKRCFHMEFESYEDENTVYRIYSLASLLLMIRWFLAYFIDYKLTLRSAPQTHTNKIHKIIMRPDFFNLIDSRIWLHPTKLIIIRLFIRESVPLSFSMQTQKKKPQHVPIIIRTCSTMGQLMK